MIWEACKVNLLSHNQIVMTALAHVFCQYVTFLYDQDQNVAQRATLQLRLLGDQALEVSQLKTSSNTYLKLKKSTSYHPGYNCIDNSVVVYHQVYVSAV